MKKLLVALLATVAVGVAFAEAEVKEVCHPKVDKAGKPVLDKKTGEQAQECKKIKVHAKLDGTTVPEKAPKK